MQQFYVIFTNLKIKYLWAGGLAQMVQHLPNKCETLN
jgi:hypothetical protein